MSSKDLPICVACGSQYSLPPDHAHPSNCKICDDPRQFIPPEGQQWTTLSTLRKSYKNVWERDPVNPRIWYGTTEPKFGIGQRAILLMTERGNVLWDLVALIDDEMVKFGKLPDSFNSGFEINSKGGLRAIVISHPHFYTTYLEWASCFKCPVYISSDDREWLCRKPSDTDPVRYLEGPLGSSQEIVEGVTAIKAGGHFPGSLVLHWDQQLFIADTIGTVPSAYSPHPRPAGQTSYTFQWSFPNMIPLDPDAIMGIWRAVRDFDFHTTYGGFEGMNVRDGGVKGRVLESMKVQVRREGWKEHGILDEVVP